MNSLFIGKDTDGVRQELMLNRANRHGLVAGATGTGKTVTLQILAEGFSRAGVPVFAADVKGDLSGIAAAGSKDNKLHNMLTERAISLGIDDYEYEAIPTVFWDLQGERGHPVRTTISSMGSQLLSRLMGLTDVQRGVLDIAFDVSEEKDMPLVTIKDLKKSLRYIADNSQKLSMEYGNITDQSIGAIVRGLVSLKREGARKFFDKPALDLNDMINVDENGRGVVNILSAEKLINNPKLYCTFLLWLLNELFNRLPEVGDPDKPVMAFFFDEAHLLFDEAPKELVKKITQVARLIRSKGVSIWFITQSPTDLPDDVLGQIGNRIQHALRGYTPKELKSIKASAESFRQNENFKTADIISDLGVGEALVSVLNSKGIPKIVGRTKVRPPVSRLGPISDEERDVIVNNSKLYGVYEAPDVVEVVKEEILPSDPEISEKFVVKSNNYEYDPRVMKEMGIIPYCLLVLYNKFNSMIDSLA